MTRSQARFLIVCALVLLFAGLGIASSGNWFGWILAGLGAVNSTLAFLLLRKSTTPLP